MALSIILAIFSAWDSLRDPPNTVKSWENTKSYIDTIKKFWKMGYSSFNDYAIIAVAQTGMFLMPIKLQHWVYKKFLRK